jgi:ribosome biogenesis GTPase
MDRSECDIATPTELARTRCPRADTNVSGLHTGDRAAPDADASFAHGMQRIA